MHSPMCLDIMLFDYAQINKQIYKINTTVFLYILQGSLSIDDHLIPRRTYKPEKHT
jgi:hypothetical protein